jgi:hypothetical protein
MFPASHSISSAPRPGAVDSEAAQQTHNEGWRNSCRREESSRSSRSHQTATPWEQGIDRPLPRVIQNRVRIRRRKRHSRVMTIGNAHSVLRACAWCERVELNSDWVKPEVAIGQLRLPASRRFHGGWRATGTRRRCAKRGSETSTSINWQRAALELSGSTFVRPWLWRSASRGCSGRR